MGNKNSGNPKPHNAVLTEAKRKKALAMFMQGVSPTLIARAFKVSRQAIYKLAESAK